MKRRTSSFLLCLLVCTTSSMAQAQKSAAGDLHAAQPFEYTMAIKPSQLMIELSTADTKAPVAVKLRILSSAGKEIKGYDIAGMAKNPVKKLDISTLAPGDYFLEVTDAADAAKSQRISFKKTDRL